MCVNGYKMAVAKFMETKMIRVKTNKADLCDVKHLK